MTEYSKTECSKYQDDLKAYADGELSWLRRAAVRRHLTHCASCQKEITTMTQIADDLRAAEPGEPLSPALREKILTVPGTATPGTGSAGLLENESASGTEDSSVAERLSLNSRPALPVPVKNRRLPAWTFAAVALVAWFVFYPAFTKLRYTQQAQTTNSTADRARMQVERTARAMPPPAASAPRVTGSPFETTNGAVPSPERMVFPASAAAPVPQPHITVRLSDREAGIDGNAKSRVVYRGFGLESLNGNSNTLNGDPDLLRQVHKEASIGIQVPNPEATGDKINQMVQETGGYVAANNLSTDTDGLKSGELIVKVPEPQFETFLAAVAKLGVVVSKNVTGQDITEKTSDAHEAQDVEESDLTQAEARLKALGTHAKWEDTQNAEDLRVQLAQTRARLKLLKRMAALGTLTIDLSQTPKAAAAPPVTNGFTGSLKATTHDALQSLVGSAGALLALVIWLLAYAPLWVPLLLLGRYALKEYGKREVV